MNDQDETKQYTIHTRHTRRDDNHADRERFLNTYIIVFNV